MQVRQGMSRLEQSGTALEYFDNLVQVYDRLCEAFSEARNPQRALAARVKEHVLEQYPDRNLCLKSIASRFNMTENYISHVYKEQTGIRLPVYIEGIRLEKAAELLSSGRVTIQEAARQVGYEILSTFYRAFRKKYGASPSEYRHSVARGQEPGGEKQDSRHA